MAGVPPSGDQQSCVVSIYTVLVVDVLYVTHPREGCASVMCGLS